MRHWALGPIRACAVRPTRPRLPPPSCYDFEPKGVHLHRRLTRAARACGIAAVAWPPRSTQADTRVTESAGSTGALLVTSLCDGPAPAAPLAGSHPRRTAGTPCGRAGDVIRSALSFKVVHGVPAVRVVESGQALGSKRKEILCKCTTVLDVI